MLKIKFDPNTNVLIVETPRTVRVEKEISIGSWTSVKDEAGDVIFEVQIKEDGEDYIVNVEGADLEEDDLDEKFDISDLLSAESYEIVKYNGKFAYVVLTIQNGEHSYSSKSVHMIGKDVDLDEYGKECARDFYGTEAEENDGAFYFEGGSLAVSVLEVQEITKQEFQVLDKFL